MKKSTLFLAKHIPSCAFFGNSHGLLFDILPGIFLWMSVHLKVGWVMEFRKSIDTAIQMYRGSPLSTVSLSTVPSLVRFSNSTKQYGFPGLVRFFFKFCWDNSVFSTFHNQSAGDYCKSLRIFSQELSNIYFYKLKIA